MSNFQFPFRLGPLANIAISHETGDVQRDKYISGDWGHSGMLTVLFYLI